MGRGECRYFPNFPKGQPRLAVSRVKFWKEFRVSQQQRAEALKAAVERYKRNAKRTASHN